MRAGILFVIMMFIGFICLYVGGIILDTVFTSVESSSSTMNATIAAQTASITSMLSDVFQIIAGIFLVGAIAGAFIMVLESKGLIGGGQYQQ